MLRVVSLSFPTHKPLLETIYLYNEVCNLHIAKSLEINTLSKSKLHKALYRTVREIFPNFPSALIQCARDHAVEMLKGNKKRKNTKKKKTSSIRFDRRSCKVFLESGQLSLTTIKGRKKYKLRVPDYFKKYSSWKVKGITLDQKEKGKLMLKVIVEGEKTPKTQDIELLGIDLGLHNFFL